MENHYGANLGEKHLFFRQQCMPFVATLQQSPITSFTFRGKQQKRYAGTATATGEYYNLLFRLWGIVNVCAAVVHMNGTSIKITIFIL